MGRKIREAFRPQKAAWSYLAADYSQIELRLLAHLSEDPILMSAFQTNEDIHTFTASQIFNVPLEEVTREQRHQAKAVNFGIIYGQQAFGLSQELGIDPKRSRRIHRKYFKRYHKVKEFIENMQRAGAKDRQSCHTHGRERLIPEIHSKNATSGPWPNGWRSIPLFKGLQADLIKMAMLKIDRKLAERKLKAI